MGARKAHFKATNEKLTWEDTDQKALRISITGILSTLTIPSPWSLISQPVLSLWFYTHTVCPFSGQYPCHKRPCMSHSYKWGNKICPERLVLGETKPCWRGHCLYFRALQNYLLNSLLQNSTQDLNHQHHFSIATMLLELGHSSISGIPLSLLTSSIISYYWKQISSIFRILKLIPQWYSAKVQKVLNAAAVVRTFTF